MKEFEKYFSENDIEEVEEIAKIALKGLDTSELSKEEYVNLKELVQILTLEDLYNRRYKNV